MSEPQKPKRFRGKSIRMQLQQALDRARELEDAQPSDVTVANIKLIQTRLVVLAKMLRFDKIRKLKRELAEAQVEVERLKIELALAREQQAQATQRSSLSDLDTKLKQIDQQYYARKEEAHV